MINHLSFQNLTLPEVPGIHDLKFNDELVTRFSLSLPSNISSGAPIVLILHYGGEPTPFYGRPLLEQIYQSAWESLGAIMIAPESFGGSWASERNESLAISLFKKILDHYGCNRAKTLVTGYSAGAIGCHHLALNYPELFSAAIPIAGFPNKIEKLLIPSHFLVSENDELFPLAKISAFLETIDQNPNIKVTPVDAQSHYDIKSYETSVANCIDWINLVWKD